MKYFSMMNIFPCPASHFKRNCFVVMINYVVLQLTSLYGGPLEFLLVVESVEDPAYNAVSKLLADLGVHVKTLFKT